MGQGKGKHQVAKLSSSPLTLAIVVIMLAFRSFLKLNATCYNLYNSGKNDMKGCVTENDIDPMPLVTMQALYYQTK